MKIFFPERCSGPLLTKMRGAPRMLALIITCFFAGASGTYLLGNNFISLAVMVLGIGAILVGVATVTWLNWSQVDRTHCVSSKKKVPRITSEWHNRPKEATRAYAAVESAGAATSEVLAPEHFAINNNVWLNNDSLEYAAHTFMNLDPTVENATVKARLPGHKCAVSGYD